jgi:hypothetical protein
LAEDLIKKTAFMQDATFVDVPEPGENCSWIWSPDTVIELSDYKKREAPGALSHVVAFKTYTYDQFSKQMPAACVGTQLYSAIGPNTRLLVESTELTSAARSAGLKPGMKHLKWSGRAFLAITGITQTAESTAITEFDWTYRASDLAKRMSAGFPDSPRAGVARFQRYDDGWRLAEIQ